MGNTGQAIVITNTEFDQDGFAVAQKAGILPFDPVLDQATMLEKAAKYEWKLEGMRNIQGFYSVIKSRELTPDELNKQIISSTGRSIVNEVDSKEVSTGEAGVLVHETNSPSRINQTSLLEHMRR